MADFGLLQGGGPVSQSLQSVLGGYETGRAMRQRDEAEAEQQRIDATSQKLSRLMQDPDFQIESSPQFAQLLQKDPELANRYLKRSGLMDQRRMQEYTMELGRVRDAAAIGDLAGAEEMLSERIERLTEQGRNPADSIRALNILEEQGPEAFVMGVDNMMKRRTGADQRGIGREMEEPKVGRIRSVDLGDRVQFMDSANGDILDTVYKGQTTAEEIEQRRDELQAQAEKEELAASRRERREGLFTLDEGIGYAEEAASVAGNLLNSEDLDDIVGFGESTPTIMPSSKALVNEANRLQSLLTKDNLDLMSGVLSESDIAILSRVASSLNITDGGIEGDEQYVKQELNRIKNKLETAANTKRRQLDSDLFVGKFSPMLDREISMEDVRAIRKKGYTTREIYQRLGVED